MWFALRTQFLQFVRNFLQRLIPRDWLPLAATPLTFPFERRFHSVWVIEFLNQCETFGAEGALIDRMMRVALYPDSLPLYHTNQNAAASITTTAN